MRVLPIICLFVLPVAMAAPWSNGEMSAAEEYNAIDDGESYNPHVERREWCARWGDTCVPDAKVKFAKCCAGMRCDCGSALLGSGKCQCRKESVFGRR